MKSTKSDYINLFLQTTCNSDQVLKPRWIFLLLWNVICSIVFSPACWNRVQSSFSGLRIVRRHCSLDTSGIWPYCLWCLTSVLRWELLQIKYIFNNFVRLITEYVKLIKCGIMSCFWSLEISHLFCFDIIHLAFQIIKNY